MAKAATPRLVGRPRKADDGEAKSRILESAIMVFADVGIAASTVKEIARRAGVTPALIYYHFNDKDRLVTESLERHLVPVVMGFWEPAGLGLAPRDMLLEMVRRVREAARTAPWFLPIWSRELAKEGGSLREFLKPRLDRRLTALFLGAVKAGQKDGTINPDLAPELVYVTLVSSACFSSLARPGMELIWNSAITDEALEAHVLSFITKGIEAPKPGKVAKAATKAAGKGAGKGDWPAAPKKRPGRAAKPLG